jgi:hypothetical protein
LAWWAAKVLKPPGQRTGKRNNFGEEIREAKKRPSDGQKEAGKQLALESVALVFEPHSREARLQEAMRGKSGGSHEEPSTRRT